MTANDRCVSLIAVGPNQVAPVRIPVADARLASLQTATVRTWIERWTGKGRTVFAVPGRIPTNGDRPVLVVEIPAEEYARLSAMMPHHDQ